MSVKKYLIIVIVTTLMTALSATGIVNFSEWASKPNFGVAPNKPDGTTVEEVEGLDPVDKSQPYNILVLGIDVEAKLSDVIILCQVDPVDHKVSMLSVPRDTRVKVDGRTMKINAAYTFRNGGVEQIIESVKELTGLPVHHYFLINTKALRDGVDALGGVYFTVPQNMDYEDSLQDLYIHLRAGHQLLDGNKAEQLLRFRQYPNGDIDRIKVQQEFLAAAIDQKLKVEYILKIPEIYDIIYKNTNSNMSVLQITDTGKQLLAVSGENFRSYTVPGEGQYVGNVSYYLHDQEALDELIRTEFK